jgi:pSer/pThr/pTyr-binding forkhead associated (FHA) protein
LIQVANSSRACTRLKTGYDPRVSENNPGNAPVPQALTMRGGPQGLPVETSLQKRDSVVIGRGTDCDVVIQDLKASRRHCQLTRTGDGFLLQDLGSRNGTYVNGERITGPVLLKTSHTFQVGDTMFYLG